MQKIVPAGVGGMGAIVGLGHDSIKELIEYAKEDGIVEIANYNTPEQIVLSGEKMAIKKTIKKAKELGARKALLLPVSAPFHCSLLESAGKMLKTDIEEINFSIPRIPIINNADAEIITDTDQIVSSLIRQVSSPVLWQQTVELMLEEGVRTFIEIGPGTSLSNFVKAIASNLQIEVSSESVGDLEGLQLVCNR
jgi:[acyl-carrier-protein] S-malonyltransferase